MNEWRNLVIPLLVLAFWGLRQIFERETPPANRVPPPGPRPGGPRPPEGIANRDPSLRWTGPPPPRQVPAPARTGNRGFAGDDEIIIIRPDSILPDAYPGRQAQPRRPQRGRPGAATRAPEPQPSRALGGAISQSVGQVLDRPLGLGPIDQKGSLTTSVAPSTPSEVEPPSVALARVLKTPGRLREAFILNEILQPPLALRGRRRR